MKAEIKQGYTHPSKAAHSHHYRPAFIFRCGDMFGDYPEEDLLYSWCSPVGWLDSRASPERDTWSLCVLLSFRRAKLGRKAVELWHKCACHSAFQDGWWMNSNASSTPATDIFSLCKKGMTWPLVPPWSDHTVTALLMHHKAKTSSDKKCGC